MRVVHIITGLVEGGTESLLYNLVINDTKNEHIIISLEGLEKYGKKLVEKNFIVICLSMHKNILSILNLFKLAKIIITLKPCVIQTWMYQANLYGGFVAKICGVKRIFWSLHHHKLDNAATLMTKISCYLGAKLSHIIPVKIISVSKTCTKHHISIGYFNEKFITISNGVDITNFKINFSIKNKYRKKLNIPNDLILLGMVARYDPSKDFNNLVMAINIVQKKFDNFKCLIVGPDVSVNNTALMRIINKFNISKYFITLGPRDDIPEFMNSIDINILSSKNESFGLVLAEAMACGVPCISTDVGAARSILGNTGWIVPVNNPNKLAEKIYDAIISKMKLDIAWEKRRNECRKRIVMNYSLNIMIKKYKKLWSKESY